MIGDMAMHRVQSDVSSAKIPTLHEHRSPHPHSSPLSPFWERRPAAGPEEDT
jgi:hypothetical protein